VKVLLVNIDSEKMPNLALEKIRMFHTQEGDEVTDNVGWEPNFDAQTADMIYVSCIFTKNSYKCEEWTQFDNVLIGGSGYDLQSVLPSYIAAMKPKLNFGFTLRGCIRECEFCVVPQKEGKLRIVGSIYDIWDGVADKIVLMDNNILAHRDHFCKTAVEIVKNKLKIDFNQGLDYRLLTDNICIYLKAMRREQYKFAFDHPSEKGAVNDAVDMLYSFGIKANTWYVLVGFDSTLHEDFERVAFLRSKGERPFVMRYADEYKYIPLAIWINTKQLYRKSFKKFLNMKKREKYLEFYMKHYPEIVERY
jgi:hypothetical protein